MLQEVFVLLEINKVAHVRQKLVQVMTRNRNAMIRIVKDQVTINVRKRMLDVIVNQKKSALNT